MVMDRLEKLSVKEFIEIMYELAFELKKKSIVSERKIILSSIRKSEKDIAFTKKMETYYDKYLRNIIRRNTTVSLDKVDFTRDEEILIAKSDVLADIVVEEIAPYLTCFSKYERLLIIWLYRNKLLYASHIRELYPDLYHYMGFEDSEGLRDLVEPMHREATSADYDNLLRVCMGYLDKANNAVDERGTG